MKNYSKIDLVTAGISIGDVSLATASATLLPHTQCSRCPPFFTTPFNVEVTNGNIVSDSKYGRLLFQYMHH